MSNPSSFSSISFETKTAIKFKKLAKEQGKTNTQLLNELIAVVIYLPERLYSEKLDAYQQAKADIDKEL